MIYSIVIPIHPSPAEGLAPCERPLPRRVMPVIEVSCERSGVSLENGEEAYRYDRQGYLEIRQQKGLFIDGYF